MRALIGSGEPADFLELGLLLPDRPLLLGGAVGKASLEGLFIERGDGEGDDLCLAVGGAHGWD